MASFSSFSSGNTPNPSALLEQACLVGALYDNATTLINQIVSTCGGATQLAYQWDDQSLPPSYQILQQGNTVVINITGTTNWSQMIGNIVGAYAIPYPGATGSVHSFFYTMALPIISQLQSVLPGAWSGYNFMVSGHSLGGAVAWIVAQYLAQQVGASKVQMVGFGTPKATTSSFVSVTPGTQYLIGNVGDAVPFLPPTATLLDIDLSNILVFASLPANWHHQEDCWQLDVNGNLASTTPNTFDQVIAPTVNLVNGLQHPMSVSLARLNLLWQGTNQASQDAPLIAISNTIQGLPPAQNNSPTISGATSIDIPATNEEYFGGSDNAPITPSNLNQIGSVSGRIISVNSVSTDNIGDSFMATSSTSGFFKVSFIFTDGTYGTSESHVYKSSAGTQLADVMTQAVALAGYRQKLLGNNQSSSSKNISAGTPALNWIRVSDIQNPKLSLLSSPLGLFGSDYGTYSECVFPATMVSQQLMAVDSVGVGTPPNQTFRTTRSNLLITFLPDGVMKNEKYNNLYTTSLGQTWQALFNQYTAQLTAANTPWGLYGLAASEVKKPCSAFTLIGGKTWQFTCTGHGYNTGDRVRITHANTRGFNGSYSVSVVDANTLSINQFINPLFVPATFARVQRVALFTGIRVGDFYPYTQVVGTQPTLRKKDPGRAFQQATFRHRKPRPI